jgi:hypothetical protein
MCALTLHKLRPDVPSVVLIHVANILYDETNGLEPPNEAAIREHQMWLEAYKLHRTWKDRKNRGLDRDS